MISPLEQFKMQHNEIRKLHDLHAFLKRSITPGVDTDGLLRAQLVFIVSALDHYIHQIIVSKAHSILESNSIHPLSFNKLQLGLDSLNAILSSGNMDASLQIVEQDIRTKLSWRSFQHPDKISEALKMVDNTSIWPEVSLIMDKPTGDIKMRLSLIVERRDCIAHEADYDLVNGCQYTISSSMVSESVNFVTELVFILDSILMAYTYDKSCVYFL